MLSRGRKSAAEKSVFATMATFEKGVRPLPPETLPHAAAQIWKRVVDAMPPDWFTPETFDILESYCRHVASAAFIDKVIQDIENSPEGNLPEWRRMANAKRQEDRIISMLATRMRLTQQSGYDKMAAATAKKKQVNSSPSVPVQESLEPAYPFPPADPWS